MNAIYQRWPSPVGELVLVASETHLLAVVYAQHWDNIKKRFSTLTETESPLLKKTKRQLAGYFAGKIREFDLPLHPIGTEFQVKTWRSLSKIPFGETRSYKNQAEALNSPKAVRAVGRTNGLNPLSIVLPCHRVVGSDGSLTGYAGGLAAKAFLLKLERDILRISQSTPAAN